MKRSIMVALEVVAGMALITTNTHAGEGTLREALVNDGRIKAVYAIDDTHTFVLGDASVMEESGAVITARHENAGGETGFLVTHSTAQPYIYRSASVPAYTEVALPDRTLAIQKPWGEGSLTGADLFQQASAVCRKSEGAASFIVTKKYGRFSRLVESNAAETFEQILSGNGGAWFIKCDGRQKFLVEKDFRAAGGSEVANLHRDRGFEGIDYLKNLPDRLPVERVPGEKELAANRLGMAREISRVGSGFVKIVGGVKYTGSYDTAGGCALVSLTETAGGTARQFEFKVCNDRVAGFWERTNERATGLLAKTR